MDAEPFSRRRLPADAAMSEWRAADGWPCRRLDWAPAPGVARRGALLFAGGRGDFIEKYLEAYAWWRDAGWAVTAFDWRGQGRSRGNILRGNYPSFDPLIDDLAGLIEAWRREAAGPHLAIGHSMGGHLLLRTLVDRAPALDAAVLVAPMIRVNSWPMPSWLTPQIADMMCAMGWRDEPVWKLPDDHNRLGSARHRNLTSSEERYADELFWWEEEPGMSIGAPSWGWMRAAFASAEASFTEEKLKRVTLPVLILATEQDRLVSADAIREAAAALPNARVEWVNEAAHEILRESDPIRLDALARLDRFLDEVAD